MSFNEVKITVKKESHNIEYVVIIPVALFVLIFFREMGLNLPREYVFAIFGVSIYTPLTWAIIDIYSLFKSEGKYVYQIEIETYNIVMEILLGAVAYLITQITIFILDGTTNIFSMKSGVYFMFAYVGILVARYIDRKLIRAGGFGNIIFSFLFTITYMVLYSALFLLLFPTGKVM